MFYYLKVNVHCICRTKNRRTLSQSIVNRAVDLDAGTRIDIKQLGIFKKKNPLSVMENTYV